MVCPPPSPRFSLPMIKICPFPGFCHLDRTLRPRSLDVTTYSAIQRRRILFVVALPLLGRLALCGPGVDAGNLVLEGGVDEAVALERVEALELRGDDEGRERLAAATCAGEMSVLSGLLLEILAFGGVVRGKSACGICLPDMSVTSTWVAWRRSVIVSRRLASVICAILEECGSVPWREVAEEEGLSVQGVKWA